MCSSADPSDSLRDVLTRAVAGLVYSSESDNPFEVLDIDSSSRADSPGDDMALATLLAGPLGPRDRVEGRTLEQFFKRHIETSDPYDSRAQAIRPRYEALRALLHESLDDARVLRVVRAEDPAVVRSFIVGRNRAGQLMGLATSSIET